MSGSAWKKKLLRQQESACKKKSASQSKDLIAFNKKPLKKSASA
jgi:hypothetical protein